MVARECAVAEDKFLGGRPKSRFSDRPERPSRCVMQRIKAVCVADRIYPKQITTKKLLSVLGVSPHLFYEREHIFRYRGVKIHLITVARMYKSKSFGVQPLPL